MQTEHWLPKSTLQQGHGICLRKTKLTSPKQPLSGTRYYTYWCVTFHHVYLSFKINMEGLFLLCTLSSSNLFPSSSVIFLTRPFILITQESPTQ